MTDLNAEDRRAFEAIVARLEAGWNAADAAAFGAAFALDADLVTIRAEHARGRDAITAGHDHIFRTMYAGSRNRSSIASARLLRPDVALVHVDAVLDAPSGPMAGRNRALISLVLTREVGEWMIASFHNTLVPPDAATGGRPPQAL